MSNTNATKATRELAARLVQERQAGKPTQEPSGEAPEQLGPEDYVRHVAVYLEHIDAVACPVCGTEERYVHPPLVFSIEKPTLPVAPMPTLVWVTCQHCGHARAFALNAMLRVPLPE